MSSFSSREGFSQHLLLTAHDITGRNYCLSLSRLHNKSVDGTPLAPCLPAVKQLHTLPTAVAAQDACYCRGSTFFFWGSSLQECEELYAPPNNRPREFLWAKPDTQSNELVKTYMQYTSDAKIFGHLLSRGAPSAIGMVGHKSTIPILPHNTAHN